MNETGIEKIVLNGQSFIEWIFPPQHEPSVRIKYGPFVLVYSPVQIYNREQGYLATQLESHRLFGETFGQFSMALQIINGEFKAHEPLPIVPAVNDGIHESAESTSSLNAFILNNVHQERRFASLEAAFSYGHYLYASSQFGQRDGKTNALISQLAHLTKKFAEGCKDLKNVHTQTIGTIHEHYFCLLRPSLVTLYH